MAEVLNADRPILWGQVGPPVTYKPNVGGSATVEVPSRASQGQRLGSRFTDLDNAFSEQATLSQSLGASEPQLVVVFEAIDEREDLSDVAVRAGLEILIDVARDYEPDSDFPRTTKNQDLPVGGCLHAVCVSEEAKANVLRQWRKWQDTGKVDTGYAPLRRLFEHLKDVRPWGPADRVRAGDVAEALKGMLPGDHTIEIELWYRRAETARHQAEADVTALIELGGGRVISAAQIADVGYHGMKCTVPLDVLQALASGDYDALTAVKSAHVMYLRVSSQSYSISDEVAPSGTSTAAPPTGDPVLCVLDGVPVANHALLRDRIIVTDPDDLAAETVVDTGLRRHGTAMASVCVWGDLSLNEAPATRPVLVRPILTPAQDTLGKWEELPSAELAPDLMRRVFRELFEGDGFTDATAPSVVVVNLSVGDPAAPFDGVVSSWARTLDWLSVRYGVVIIVSSGNHGTLTVPDGTDALVDLTGADRAAAVNSHVAHTNPRRSLLAPADAINAVTVGALNDDGAGDVPVTGYQFDPADGTLIVSPTSGLGSGHHRSVKPDVIAPGGRSRFMLPMVGGATEIHPATQSALGPGIKVAAAAGGEAFTVGTSPAAASVSRAAARAVDTVLDLAGRNLTRSELAVATKAMVTHAARVPDDLIVHDGLRHAAHGYGILARHLADGCDPNEASILFVGNIGENEARTLALPLPNGLQARGVKRVTATLAWLSPVNWRHRQYRRAVLEFSKPKGLSNLGTALGAVGDKPKRGTLQHVEWEVVPAVGVGQGTDLELTVNCKGQAGGLRGERVDFGVVLSLWVAPELNVDVYAQVQQQVAARVAVAP
ncbi:MULTISPECIES: S8 family peptidase [unclassified Aeromicrobium]|uniref:S8 family peptidase n=1 Tax=unclassified Aeromicrobium TaxID=2633570 RepID=UPI00396B3915